jgi:hypothetical protein
MLAPLILRQVWYVSNLNIQGGSVRMLSTIRQEIERLKGAGATYVDARWYPFEDANYLAPG